MKLLDVYSVPREAAVDLLWGLLVERPPEANISHKRMPTVAQHREFIESRPYAAWNLIDVGEWAGAVYLTHQREIGIGILRKFWGDGYAKNAIQMLMAQHPGGRVLAHVAPGNERSIGLFSGMGFRLIQCTYSLELST